MKLTTGYKKPIASSGTDAQEQSSNNSYLLLAGGGHKALSELVSPADLTTELSNYVTIGSNQTITGVKTFSQAINADITGNADTVDGEHAVAFAHIGAHNNLTVNNEFTFVSNGFSGDIWFNYRTAGGTNGNITDYIFGNGKEGQLYSLKTIATNASTAYSWGNHANAGYLLRSDIGSQSVNYATNAGNAGTLNGHTSDDFVLKTTHDVYESVIVESLNDLDNRKIEVSDLPTSLPANGGHADTATNVDWSGITNKPSSLPANGGNADTINGYSSSDFVLNTNYGEFKSVVATALTDLDSRKIDKEDGKGLSTNDYTTEEKTKLAGIEEGAQVNDPNTVIDANYVHTDNNYTTAEKNKLSGIEIGAQVNTVNSVAGKTGDVTLNVSNISGLQSALDGKQDNLEFTSSPSSSNKVVTQNELNSVITGQSSYLGTIESVSSLLTTAKKGDFYRIKTAWSGVHVGDLIIAEKDNPVAIIDEVNWSLLHNEMDTDTTYTFEDGIDGFSVTPSVGNKQKVNISVGYATSAGNANTATSIDWNGVTNKPVIGNGRLILKNGNDIISDDFTANKVDDTTIDFNSKFINKSDFNLLGDKIDKIDTSILELNTAVRVNNPFDDSGDDDEDTIESNDDMFGDNVVGSIDLRFYGITSEITTYVDLHVYFVNVAKICDISEVGNSISSLYNIRITIDLTGTTIASTVGISSDTFKQFYIRGANMKNHICGFDVRGNGTTNTATAIMSGKYLLLNCQLKLHGDKSDIGSFIMEEAKNGNFKAYLCLRQTI